MLNYKHLSVSTKEPLQCFITCKDITDAFGDNPGTQLACCKQDVSVEALRMNVEAQIKLEKPPECPHCRDKETFLDTLKANDIPNTLPPKIVGDPSYIDVKRLLERNCYQQAIVLAGKIPVGAVNGDLMSRLDPTEPYEKELMERLESGVVPSSTSQRVAAFKNILGFYRHDGLDREKEIVAHINGEPATLNSFIGLLTDKEQKALL